ncbi:MULTISPECIES: murein L,D-transpeptidase [Flavobacterium]|uniref:L,D-transpeptidase family protein n=2 Tax=Flavobacterium TaxID=237 RepID=A0ABW8PPD7_9FLAO|nr:MULTISPECIES: L,D-transpeptidase family protein [Flavobacterium]QYS88320.1 L,D-transpeptidase family protein [Flavobacterium davisii]SPE77895.1 murein L,D-transpeptidase [Flavobacterium columnare]
MKKFYSILLSVLIYVSCANNTNPRFFSTEESIEKALKNETLLDNWDLDENRMDLLEAIRKSTEEGLNPEDYHYSELLKYEDSIVLTSDQKESYHQLLTIALIKYSSHLRNGKLNANEIYSDWEITPKPIVTDSILSIILAKKQVDSLIKQSKPHHFIYNQLKKALLKINTMPDEVFDTIKPKLNEKLYFGLKNSGTISKIKKRLRLWGDLKSSDTLVNKTFDENLKKAIISFQKRHGLQSDGLIGLGTLKALNYSKEYRKRQIMVNLERWRWFPADLGNNFLAVNLTDFELQVVENNDTTKTYRVVIGQPKRKTPILSSKVDNIIFNPTWTVPPTIIKEDLVPAATKSRNYFYKSKIKIFNTKNKEISPYSWKPEDALTYKYVQSPGYNNSLGLVKINFNNNHLVYMHDTNHRELFTNQYRALSSGCVRIEKPLPLAEYLLRDKLKKEYIKEEVIQKNKTKNSVPTYKKKLIEIPVYSLAEIDTIIQKKETKAVRVSQNFGIHFLYFTAWYDKGLIQFRNDIYQYDSELYLRLSDQLTNNIISSSRVINK